MAHRAVSGVELGTVEVMARKAEFVDDRAASPRRYAVAVVLRRLMARDATQAAGRKKAIAVRVAGPAILAGVVIGQAAIVPVMVCLCVARLAYTIERRLRDDEICRSSAESRLVKRRRHVLRHVATDQFPVGPKSGCARRLQPKDCSTHEQPPRPPGLVPHPRSCGQTFGRPGE